ncbi:GDSL-type esterase/lipase family protein [Agromyces silvae]|uniref:GDSL-type esterase/lipase family protein n=1 Tax=Agromyces silvae TaxID=3388266 RepID=UPI00280B3F74|nr:GDSL-type esterase/lipase family protein [Agromyces protaetiae]
MSGALGDVPLDSVEVRGAVELERTERGLRPHRLPAWARAQVPSAFAVQTTAESAGVRLAFRTAARTLALVVHARRMVPDDTGEIPPGSYELTAGGRVVATATGAAGSRYVFTFENPEGRIVEGPPTTVRFSGLAGADTEYELWLPYTDAVELVALRADAAVLPPSAAAAGPSATPPAGGRPLRWLHHGSSISHGYRADTTTGTWPVVAALAAGVELTNLAFSGNAVLDPFTARTMRETPADLITLKIGINLVNGDLMRMRTFRPAVDGFLDTLREGHPTTPIVVISPIWCEPVEDAAGPTVQDPSRADEWSIAGGTTEHVAEGKLSLRSIRAALAEIVARRSATDPNLAYLDGLELYGGADASAMPLPDNLHPGADVHRLIGDRFATRILTPLA